MATELANAELLGRHVMSETFACGEGRFLKLYRPHMPGERVKREHLIGCAIHAAGVPVPAVYEVVEWEGRHGIIFERIGGKSLLRHVEEQPWILFRAARQLAELHFQLHQHRAPEVLPPQKQRIADRITASTKLTGGEKDSALRSLGPLPEGEVVCHGDFHPENILLTASGPVIVDWFTGSRGHALGDVAQTLVLFDVASLPPDTTLTMKTMMLFSRRLLRRIYLRRYLELSRAARSEIDAWVYPLTVAARG